MKTLFKLIATQLRTQLSLVNLVDLWNNQLENTDRSDGDFDKSIFIEFIFEQMETTGNNVNHGTGIVRVHITQLAYVDTASGGVDDDCHNPFAVLDYVDEVHAALQGFSARHIFKDANNDEVTNKLCTSMQRISIVQDTNHSALHHWIMDYTTQITDYQAQNSRKYISVTPVESLVERVVDPIDRD